VEAEGGRREDGALAAVGNPVAKDGPRGPAGSRRPSRGVADLLVEEALDPLRGRQLSRGPAAPLRTSRLSAVSLDPFPVSPSTAGILKASLQSGREERRGPRPLRRRLRSLPRSFGRRRRGFTTRTCGEAAAASQLARGLAKALGRRRPGSPSPGRSTAGRSSSSTARRPVAGRRRRVGDALMTREEGVFSASSRPTVSHPPGRHRCAWIAAVHAGWRGTAARILDAVLDLLEEKDVPASRLVARSVPASRRVDTRSARGGRDVERRPRRRHRAARRRPARPRRRAFLDVAAFNTALLVARVFRPAGSSTPLSAPPATRPLSLLPPRRERTGRIVTGILRRPPA